MFVKSLIFQTWKSSGAIRSTPLPRYECETPDIQFYQRGGRWCWKSSRELGQSGHHNSKNKIQSVINWILQSSQIGILFEDVENIFSCGFYTLFCRTYVRWMHLHWIVHSVIGGDGRGEWNKSQKMNQDVVWLSWMHFLLLASVTSSAWEQWLRRVTSTRASNEGSQRFHNHGDGP